MPITTSSPSISIYKGEPILSELLVIRPYTSMVDFVWHQGDGVSVSSSIDLSASLYMNEELGYPVGILDVSTNVAYDVTATSTSIKITQPTAYANVVELAVGEGTQYTLKLIYDYVYGYTFKGSGQDYILLKGSNIYNDGTVFVKNGNAICQNPTDGWNPQPPQRPDQIILGAIPQIGLWPYAPLSASVKVRPSILFPVYEIAWPTNGTTATEMILGPGPWPSADWATTGTLSLKDVTGSTMSFNTASSAYGVTGFTPNNYVVMTASNYAFDGSTFVQTFIARLDTYPAANNLCTLFSFGTSSATAKTDAVPVYDPNPPYGVTSWTTRTVSGTIGWNVYVDSTGSVRLKSRTSNTIYSTGTIPLGQDFVLSVGYQSGNSGSLAFKPFVKINTGSWFTGSFSTGTFVDPLPPYSGTLGVDGSPVQYMARLGASSNAGEGAWSGSIYQMRLSNGQNSAGAGNFAMAPISESFLNDVHAFILNDSRPNFNVGKFVYYSYLEIAHVNASYNPGTGVVTLTNIDSVQGPKVVFDLSGNLLDVTNIDVAGNKFTMAAGLNAANFTFPYGLDTYILTGDPTRGDGGKSASLGDFGFDALSVTGYDVGSGNTAGYSFSIQPDVPFIIKGGGFLSLKHVQVGGLAAGYTSLGSSNSVVEYYPIGPTGSVVCVKDDQTIEMFFPCNTTNAPAWNAGTAYKVNDLVQFYVFGSDGGPAGVNKTFYFRCQIPCTNVKPSLRYVGQDTTRASCWVQGLDRKSFGNNIATSLIGIINSSTTVTYP
jgi:hypothetical protein